MCTAHVLMRFCYLTNRSFVCKAKEGHHIRIMIDNRVWNKINKTDPTSGAGTAYPSGAHEFLVGFVLLDLKLLCVVFCRSLIVPFLLVIVLSAFLRLTDSDYTFDIFKLFLS